MTDHSEHDPVTAVRIGETRHGPCAASDLPKGAFDHIGGTHLCRRWNLRGERFRTSCAGDHPARKYHYDFFSTYEGREREFHPVSERPFWNPGLFSGACQLAIRLWSTERECEFLGQRHRHCRSSSGQDGQRTLLATFADRVGDSFHHRGV